MRRSSTAEHRPGFRPVEGCDLCDPDGFCRVAPQYAVSQVPGVEAAHLALVQEAEVLQNLGDSAPAEMVARYERNRQSYIKLAARRATFTDMVYPCPRCKAEQYRRWRNGCYRPDHDRFGCDVCGERRL